MGEIRDLDASLPDPDEYGRIDSFAALIFQLGLDQRLITEVREVIEAIRLYEGQGTVTLTLKISDDDPVLRITPTVKQTKPRPPVGARVLYADADGWPAKDDPYQRRLPLNLKDRT